MEKDWEAFIEQVNARLGEGRSLKALHHADGTWAAYFEGEAQGKVALAIVGEGNDEMLAKLNEKCGDDELALRALAHGDGVWLMYFEGELTGDAMWVLHSDFVEFSKLVNTQQAEDKYMHEVTYGNGAWVGYWEGTVSDDIHWSWGARSNVKEFLAHVEKQWEDEDGVEGGSPTKPVAAAPEAAAAAAAATTAASTSTSTATGTAPAALPACPDDELKAALKAAGVFDTAWPPLHAEQIDDLETLASLERDDMVSSGVSEGDAGKILAHFAKDGAGGGSTSAGGAAASGERADGPKGDAKPTKDELKAAKAKAKLDAAEAKKMKKEEEKAAKLEAKRVKEEAKKAKAAEKQAAKDAKKK